MVNNVVPIKSTLLFEDFLLWKLPRSKEFQIALKWAEVNIEAILEFWTASKIRGYSIKKEGELEEALIRPLLQKLGFSKANGLTKHPCYSLFPTLYGSQNESYEPDYALFASGSDLKSANSYRGSKDNQFFDFSVGVGDAKAWEIDLDKKTRHESPSQQILKYLIHSRKRYGFLTNGRKWRLYRAASPSALLRPDVYLEVNLDTIFTTDDKILVEWHNQRKGSQQFNQRKERIYWLAYFKLFFGPESFIGDGVVPYRGKENIEILYQTGLRERIDIQDDLKERVFNSLQVVCRGFYNCPQWKKLKQSVPSFDDLKELYSSSLLFLYRLLFILNTEARGLLDSIGYRAISLNRLADDLENHFRTQIQQSLAPTYTFWRRILDIFNVISDKERADEVGVTHYDGGLFDATIEGHESLELWQLDDNSLYELIQLLVFKEELLGKRTYKRIIDFGSLEVRHLGQIYEGLLEFQLKYTDKDLFLVNGKYLEKNPKSSNVDEIIYKNNLYLATDKMERKVTGTYYTPDHIVDYIVESSLDLFCQNVSNWTQIRNIRVLDPAMGSGHFLVATIDYLAGTLYNHPNAELPPEYYDENIDELILWKRFVAEQCIYGVDKNPLAVELAKLAIWLATANKGRTLSFLDAQLRLGDSLLGTTLSELDSPPLAKKGNGVIRTGEIKQTTLTKLVQEKIDSIAKIAEQIDRAPANTALEIKSLREAHRKSVKTPLESLRVLADIWMNQWFISSAGGKIISEKKYSLILKSAVSGELRPSDAGKFKRPYFHWDLEFPHIFRFGKDNGFDIIIGNPPYEVLASKEIGESIEDEKEFFKKSGFFNLAAEGKMNLFSLFIIRCLQLLDRNGILSLIVPITLLGFTQTRLLRRWFLSCADNESLQQRWQLQPAGFVEICAFPQKDNPTERVFRDAKQATCIFVASAFPKRIDKIDVMTYPKGDYHDKPKSYTISKSDIGLLDKDELVIPHSATQKEIEIALKTSRHPAFIKLGELARVSQGEFNITTSKKKGLTTDKYHPEKPRLLRGAHIARYRLQEAKQGTELYVSKSKVQAIRLKQTSYSKLDDVDKSRILFQEASPADNYRRLIGTLIGNNHYCGHTINYITDPIGQSLSAILAVFNSSLSEWRFRLTSSTNHVSGRETENILLPRYEWTKEIMEIQDQLKDKESQTKIDSMIKEREDKTQEILLDIKQKGNQKIKGKIQSAISSGYSNGAWKNIIHDSFAAFGFLLSELGERINTTVSDFLNWADDYLNTETRKWKGSSKFRLFQNVTFKEFLVMCKENKVEVGRETHKTLSNEFQDVHNIITSCLTQMIDLEDIIDQSLYTMFDFSVEECRIVKDNSGLRIPTS